MGLRYAAAGTGALLILGYQKSEVAHTNYRAAIWVVWRFEIKVLELLNGFC